MKSTFFALVIFLILTLVATFPLVLKMNDHIPGFFSTDEPSLWYFWWLNYAQEKGTSSTYCNLIAAPFGVDFSVIEIVFPIWVMFKKIIVRFSNPFFAYNTEILLSFILSGFFMYLLVRYLTRSNLSAVLSGIIFAYCPYHFVRAWQHINLAHIQWMPLYIYALFRLKDRICKRNMLFAVFALFMVASFDYYYLYFMAIVTLTFVFFNLFYLKKRGLRLIGSVILSDAIAMLMVFFLISPLFLGGYLKQNKVTEPDAWSYTRPFEDLFSQSARPLSYLLPSSEHPLFGEFTRSFLGTSLYGTSFTEHALFLSFTGIFLAYLAYRRLRQKKRVFETEDAEEGRQNYSISFFVTLTIVAWLFSQPPWWNIFGLKLYMPSFVMYKIAPIFRAYCRFGIIVMLAVAALAGFGLKFILEKFAKQKIKVVIAVLFYCLVLFEFWNYPPYKVIDLSRTPQAYLWLKNQPQDMTVADYPIDSVSGNELYRFYQTRHGKRIINFTGPGTYANDIAQQTIYLSSPSTSGILKWLGVKYVLVHRKAYLENDLTEWHEELKKIPLNSKLKFIRNFSDDDTDIYEVVSEPVKPK